MLIMRLRVETTGLSKIHGVLYSLYVVMFKYLTYQRKCIILSKGSAWGENGYMVILSHKIKYKDAISLKALFICSD
jgi:hypothetical protein